MGQLIKLENYISRYQQDIYHYSSQYIRLKQKSWKQMYQRWESEVASETKQPLTEEKNSSIWQKWKSFTRKNEPVKDNVVEPVYPQTEEQLKQYFLDSLLKFQLNWASTTLSKMSFLDRNYYNEFVLKYCLQRFPDTYFIMYKTLFKLINAVVDVDLIMITPSGIYVIQMVEFRSDEIIIVDNDRSWLRERASVQTSFLSPMVALNRSAKIISSILDYEQIDFPIEKVILSRTNQINYDYEPYQTKYIDVTKHEDWLKEQRQLSMPLKHQQLKAADALLKHSDTVSVHRAEWNDSGNETFI